MISNALEINQFMPKYIANSIEKTLTEMKLPKSVIICGLSYKQNTEDMRDSPGFKIVNELKNKGFDIATYDPFFKNELVEKYLIENKLEKQNFVVLDNLENNTIKKFSCLCIVQHHTKIKSVLEQIYHNDAISVIYDCQNNIEKKPNSKTVLKSLGN
jgi:UDP-N-acetyl-D-mannosaminuronate dehydrogenase